MVMDEGESINFPRRRISSFQVPVSFLKLLKVCKYEELRSVDEDMMVKK